MVSKFSNKALAAGKKVSALFAGTFAMCMSTMMALATTGSPAGAATYTDDGTFTNMGATIGGVIASALNMLRSFIVPLAAVACLCSILLMYLPGMSSKTTDRCKSVIWACIATVGIAYALDGIFRLAGNIGGKII